MIETAIYRVRIGLHNALRVLSKCRNILYFCIPVCRFCKLSIEGILFLVMFLLLSGGVESNPGPCFLLRVSKCQKFKK